MAVTVTETVGSASANSFVTVAEADTYLESRLNSSAWTGTDEKKISLIEATRELSRLTDWLGERVDSTQALSWPRSDVVNPDDPDDADFADTVIPQGVKDATFELALEFLRAGTTDIASTDPNAGVIEKTVDVLTTRWAEGQRVTGTARFDRVWGLIENLRSPQRSGVRLVR